jgi:hypothetical protein
MIGHLMPEQRDIWWSSATVGESSSVAAEIVRCVEQFGLPALAQVSTVPALRRLWESGCSPGLTDHQRARYLQQLRQCNRSCVVRTVRRLRCGWSHHLAISSPVPHVVAASWEEFDLLSLFVVALYWVRLRSHVAYVAAA